MSTYALRRLLSTLPVIVAVAVLVFVVLRLAPGDPALAIAGDGATPQELQRMRAQLGLDKTLFEQFLIWGRSMLRLDFGNSLYYHVPVTTLIGQRILPTANLALLTMLMAVPTAVGLGTLAASRQGSLVDRAVNAFAVLAFSVPVFVLGYVLIWLFAVHFALLPVQGLGAEGASPGVKLLHYLLPAVGLAFGQIALLTRVTRASVIDTLGEDYIRTAYAKGASARRVLWRHAVRTAAVPIVTVIGLSFAVLIGGVVVTETVYAIPGLGKLTVDAVLARDFPVVQGLVIFFSALYVGINLVVDLLYMALDPRIRY
ncbi:ABC transporter permease [Stenotrophomonas mori]|uniref:ABC transporter permease n=1 Tax=Stenotrophomonas mori TaxID=2871096 RepID=A0ABT0SHV4_9GAMM|nr:ABC transporter permease [Stenotrophomonas mori]MCL7714832.1 ABC transporter permease [Stenotrophomonas mori]